MNLERLARKFLPGYERLKLGGNVNEDGALEIAGKHTKPIHFEGDVILLNGAQRASLTATGNVECRGWAPGSV
jgi:hypothetical protein